MRLGRHSLAMARPGACGECRVASFSTAVGGAAALGAVGAQGNYLEPGIPESSRLATWPKRGEDFYIQTLALALAARVAARMPPPEMTRTLRPTEGVR